MLKIFLGLSMIVIMLGGGIYVWSFVPISEYAQTELDLRNALKLAVQATESNSFTKDALLKGRPIESLGLASLSATHSRCTKEVSVYQDKYDVPSLNYGKVIADEIRGLIDGDRGLLSDPEMNEAILENYGQDNFDQVFWMLIANNNTALLEKGIRLWRTDYERNRRPDDSKVTESWMSEYKESFKRIESSRGGLGMKRDWAINESKLNEIPPDELIVWVVMHAEMQCLAVDLRVGMLGGDSKTKIILEKTAREINLAARKSIGM